MSKYDQLDYLTLSEKEGNGYPKCVTNAIDNECSVPEEFLGLPIEKFKTLFDIKSVDENLKFNFANNNQTVIKEDYFKIGKFFNENMSPDEKREFLLDYMKVVFGSDVDGKYFELYLQDMFNLKKYKLIDEDFELMIKEYFHKPVVNLDDPDDRTMFKKIMFHEHIKFLDKESAKEWISKNDNIEEESSIKESENGSIKNN